jgi:cytoskeletal protein RodZ
MIAPRADEGPVFISHADEQSLMEPADIGGAATLDEENLPLGARLRTVRHRRRLTLVQVNLDTKIPIWYLQAMEEEKFSMLPRGPVAIDMVRTYADYLGLDGSRAVADYRTQQDVSPFKPIPSLGGPPEPREIPPWLGIAVAAALALVLGLGGLWYLAGDRMPALASNIRGLVVRPTATSTPSPTVPPTITPTVTRAPTVTPTATLAPTPTATVEPSPSPAPPPPAPAATAGP